MMATIGLFLFVASHAFAQCEHGDEATCKDQIDSAVLLQTRAYATDAEEDLAKFVVDAETMSFEQVEEHGKAVASTGRCRALCEEVPVEWSAKCTWPDCNSCSFCGESIADEQTAFVEHEEEHGEVVASTGKCSPLCEEQPVEWSTKCTWADCNGCSFCEESTADERTASVQQVGEYGEAVALTAECNAWCEEVPAEWSTKCAWPHCKSCASCGVCKEWCKEVPSPWSSKCGWKKTCDGCPSCSGSQPAPPPPAPPRPVPTPAPTPTPPAAPKRSGESGSEGTPGKVPETISERFLNCHNYWRCIHGSPPIRWDKDFAQGSQEWANRGQMSHSQCYRIPPPQGPAGENLASGSSMSPEQACAMWHDEGPESGPSCGGHCTAMLWKSAYKLGCGVKGGLVVCRYGGKNLRDGTPNFGGRSAYTQNVGYPDNSKDAECKKKWPLSKKGSTNGGGGGGRGGGNPFGGSGGGNPFGGSGGGSGNPFGGSGGWR